MNDHFQHPLDTIYQDNSLLLLEAMIPYVEPSLKLPLALLIKMQEIRILMQVFHNPAQLDAYGMNRNCEHPDEFIHVMCKAMGVDFMGQLSNMQTMMNTMQMMNAMQPDTTAPSAPESMFSVVNAAAKSETEDFSTSARDDMIDAIRQVLSEQEGDIHESEPTS